jgi:hypothetical protein
MDERLQSRPAEVAEPAREEAVEPLAGFLGADGHLEAVGYVLCGHDPAF